MRVVSIAAECEPWAKTGGLGDVVDALARALGRLPEESGGPDRPVEVFLPSYRQTEASFAAAVEAAGARGESVRTTSVPVPGPYGPEGRGVTVTVRTLDAQGYRLRLVEQPEAFGRETIYGYPDDAARFGLFARAALETLRLEAASGIEPRPVDVLHLHDWHAAAALVLRDRFYAADPLLGPAASVLTVHNLAYHGWVDRAELGSLGLAPGDGVVAADAVGIDLLWAGMARSDVANTVSPTFAAESLTPAFGFGLDDTLRWKVGLPPAGDPPGPRWLGILNGLDTGVWDPATDGDLAARYSAADPSGKTACRADLLERAGFDPGDTGPVLGMIGRLDPQKGFDLLAGAADGLLALGARIVVQGSGDPSLAAPFRTLARQRPDRVFLNERFDRAMARRIYAGSDLFLMPSRFEPCGQGQMISLRYGTPPIVHRTGGLADTVVDEATRPGEGTGFVFEHPTSDGLVWACDQAFALRGEGSAAGAWPAWRALQARGMAVDFGWETGAAPAYVAAYRRAMAIRRAALGGAAVSPRARGAGRGRSPRSGSAAESAPPPRP